MSGFGPVVLVGGSRSLSGPANAVVFRASSVLVSSGVGLAVGCSVGADQQFLINFVMSGAAPRVQVFAIFDYDTTGIIKNLSAPVGVLSAAWAGARVRWLAGGALSVPPRARLVRRTDAAAAASSAGVFVLSSPESRGSLLAARSLWRRGLPALVLPVFAGLPAPLPECEGEWADDDTAATLFGNRVVRWQGMRNTPVL